MREILFRGKRIATNNWVEGSLLNYGDGDYDMCSESGMPGELNKYAVYPETVGQFAGLTDRNGKKIFEGDIVHVLGNQQVEDWKNVNYIGSIAFLDAGFCVIDGTIEDHAFRRYQLPRLDFDLEVIGNIHDNPELLEEVHSHA